MCSETPLQRLRELTPRLSDIAIRRGNSYVEFRSGTSAVIAFGLYKNGDVAVSRNFIPSGIDFQGHTHAVDVFITVYEGSLEFSVNGDISTLGPGECLHIPPNVPHSFRSLEDTRTIAVAVPAGEEFPNALC